MADFPATHLSLVMAAAGSDKALADLLEIYWRPLYVFVRRQGHSEEESKDLTQGFIAHLLEKGGLREFQHQRGRFRSFLLGSLNNFLANERDRATAQKRGGGVSPVPLDSAIQPPDNLTPERIFEKQWALALLNRALERVRPGNHFERLRGYLTGDDDGVRYAQLGLELGMSEGAVKVAVHRLRRRFHEALREEISMTVTEESQIGGELRYLVAAIRS